MIRNRILHLTMSLLVFSSAGGEDRKSIREIREASRPGDDHALLNPLVGEWKVRMQYRVRPDANPEMAMGKAEFQWILGQRFLEQIFEGKGAAGALEGRGLIGYDNLMNHYVGTWIDSMNSGMTWSTGKAHPQERVIHFDAAKTDPLTAEATDYDVYLRILNTNQVQYIVSTKSPDPNERIVVLQMDYARRR